MNDEWVLEKTASGLMEIANRSRRVPNRLRTVLILVDGRNSVGQLCASAAGLGNIREVLAELRELGLIAPLDGGLPPASRASVPPAARLQGPLARPEPQPGRRRSLALARLYLLNAMEQSLRQADMPVRERLRNCTTRADLLDAFELCREIAAEVGVAHIDTIEAQFLGMLPDEG